MMVISKVYSREISDIAAFFNDNNDNFILNDQHDDRLVKIIAERYNMNLNI
jgi:hypothetical protein